LAQLRQQPLDLLLEMIDSIVPPPRRRFEEKVPVDNLRRFTGFDSRHEQPAIA
jgi:hypothetical protein